MTANRDLPKLNPLKARSTIALAITLGAMIAPAFFEGVDPEAAGDAGVNAVEAVNVLIGIVGAVWFWFERRAPNFRLSI